MDRCYDRSAVNRYLANRDLGWTGPPTSGGSGASPGCVTEGSIFLRHQQLLRKVQQPVKLMPVVNPLPPHVDDRFSGAALTKVKKSMLSPWAVTRFTSEWYPVSKPPVYDFIAGQNSRLIGRDPVVLMP